MDEDREELIHYSDDESLSEPEDQTCSVENPKDHHLLPFMFFCHTKFEFFLTLVLLILSSFIIIIVLPLYINSINIQGNVASLILINIPLSILILLITMIVWKFSFSRFKNLSIISMPINFWKLFQISFIYITCVFLYIYASDRNKVICHLQDPIKGIVVVFALLFYFFFCRNLMGLRRIFSTTTVIVGLFIAVDYGLCDEFVCRGYDRQQVSDDAGLWSWKTHSIWTGLYIFGLTLFAAYFTLLDRHVAPEYDVLPHNIISTSFLNTISRSVTASTSNLVPSEALEHGRQTQTPFPKSKSALHLALWIHIFCLGIVLLTFWLDFIPGIGKGATAAESWNYTVHGVMCHFTKPGEYKHETNSCGNVFWYMLVFQLTYIIFSISSIKFLMLSQSAVFTIAAMSYPLPLVGIWWTLFHATPTGLLVWSPKMRGEFVCSIIGLPIVSIALGLLCTSHFEDNRRYLNVRILSRGQPAFLATGESYRSLSFAFRISCSYISIIVPIVLKSICEKLMPLQLPPPSEIDFKQKAEEFWKYWNFPNVIAAIDGKHVRIMCPDNSGSLFFNYKNYFSIVLLALVDANYKFLTVDIGSYGKEGDAGIFSKSEIGQQIYGEKFNFPPPTLLPRSTNVILPYVIIGDDAFKLDKHVIKPYPKKQILEDPEKAIFNYRLSRARRVTENAFGILCHVFRIFFTPINIKPSTVDLVILACCCLHNMLRNEYIAINPKRTNVEENIFSLPTENMIPLKGTGGFACAEGFQVRSRFTKYFVKEGAVTWQDRKVV